VREELCPWRRESSTGTECFVQVVCGEVEIKPRSLRCAVRAGARTAPVGMTGFWLWLGWCQALLIEEGNSRSLHCGRDDRFLVTQIDWWQAHRSRKETAKSLYLGRDDRFLVVACLDAKTQRLRRGERHSGV
jgi:hypothetical protein